MEHRSGPRWSVAVYLIFFGSGIAGLGYEIVWAKMFAIGLGHEMPSLLAVVAAFFGGLALGAWALDGPVSRSAVPGRWYVCLELLIGGWALLSILLVPWLNRQAASLIGLDPGPARQWLVAFALPFVALLPATAAMGATLPAMERLVARLRRSGGAVAGLYAVNTAGAVAGTIVTTFLVMPALGFGASIVALAAVNLLCATAVALGPASGERDRAPVEHAFDDPPSPARLRATLVMTGLLGIGYEVLGVRVMTQVLENTVYSFASVLSVYLLGTAVGAAVYQRAAHKRRFAVTLLWLVQGIAITCLVGVSVMQASGSIHAWLERVLGGGVNGAIGAELGLALLVFGPPTIVMGATFSHLLQAARGRAGGVGRALALNTLGGAAAPLLFGVVLLPAIGGLWSLLIVVGSYLLLLPVSALTLRRVVPLAAGALVAATLPSSLVLVQTPQGMRIVDYREGVSAAVAVLEDQGRRRLLKVNDRFSMGSTAGVFDQRRQAHIPLLLHPAPARVLFLGLGTGVTAGAATDHPGVRITGVELMPEVVDLLPRFEPENRLDRITGEHRFVVADARRFVRGTDERFDVIVADLFHPGRDGAGALYTVEHFQAIRAALAENGLFCQWLPLYQLDLETFRVILRTYLEVFPDATAWIAHFNVETPVIGLIGRAEPSPDGALRPDWYARRVTDAGLRGALEHVALSNELTLFGSILATREDLASFAGNGPINTDTHPRVIFQAPRYAYSKAEPARDRLEQMVDLWTPVAADVLAPGTTDAEIERLQRYLEARNIYLQAEVHLGRGETRRAIDGLIESVRRSADFKTAYVTAMQLARIRAQRDERAAREILRALIEANPGDPRAAEELRRLEQRVRPSWLVLTALRAVADGARRGV